MTMAEGAERAIEGWGVLTSAGLALLFMITAIAQAGLSAGSWLLLLALVVAVARVHTPSSRVEPARLKIVAAVLVLIGFLAWVITTPPPPPPPPPPPAAAVCAHCMRAGAMVATPWTAHDAFVRAALIRHPAGQRQLHDRGRGAQPHRPVRGAWAERN